MIHVFACVQKTFSCEACKPACNQIQIWLHKPLGTYVFAGVALAAAELYCCGRALVAGDVLKDCILPKGTIEQIGIANLLYVQMGFAWLNMIFAPYIQYQLYQKLKQEARENRTAEDLADGEVNLSKDSVKESFQYVFLNDIGVCLYFFALVASVVWSYYLLGWTSGGAPACDPDGYASWAAGGGMAFAGFVVFYTVCWYCYMGCMSDMEVKGVWQGAAAAAAVAGAAKVPGAGAVQYLAPRQAAARADRPGLNNAASGQRAKPGVFGGLFQKKDSQEVPLAAGAAYAGNAGGDNASNALTNEAPVKKRTRFELFTKLMVCAALDAMGAASYTVPGLGEGTDLAYSPSFAIALNMLFGSKTVALVGFTEEILPFTDAFPTATLAWFLEVCYPKNCLMPPPALQGKFAVKR